MASIESVVVVDSGAVGAHRYTFTITLLDNDSNQEVVEYGPVSADDTYDPVTEGQNIANSVLAGKSEAEEATAEDSMDDGDSLPRCLNAKWSTTKAIAKRLIRVMMRERDPRIVVYLEDLIQYIRDNYNAAQVAAFMDITTVQVIAMNNRINAILSDTGTVKAQLTVFDSEEEEIE